MILVMMSMAAPGVDSNPPVMRIFSLAAVCCLGFLLYPFHGLGGEPHVGPMVLLHCMIMPLLSYSLVLAHSKSDASRHIGTGSSISGENFDLLKKLFRMVNVSSDVRDITQLDRYDQNKV